MGFRLFTDETPWEQARKDLRYTVASVAAEADHASLAQPMRELLVQWNTIDQERRDADDALVEANASVRRLDKRLDRFVDKLSARLLLELDGDRNHPTFKKYFPEPPNEVIRLGLESEITRTAKFDTVADELGASEPVRSLLASMDDVRKHGKKALEQREEIVKTQGRVSLRVSSWKQAANSARRSVENALDAYAIERRLPRDYSEEFFPAAKASRKRKKEDKPTAVRPPS